MKKVNKFIKTKGINFIELLVGALLVEFIVIFFLFFSREVNGIVRDSKRKQQISKIGKIITNPCFIPNERKENKEYDLTFILNRALKEYEVKNNIDGKIKDPKTGTENLSMYIYKVDKDNKNCVLYSNLESSFLSRKTLNFSKPTPGGGIGIFKAKNDGWNGSPLYFQYSN